MAKLSSEEQILAIYALAFDGATGSPSDLEPKYPKTIKAFLDATASDPSKTIVVLADLNDKGDPTQTDHILAIQGGSVITDIKKLPLENGTLSQDTLYEYDMTDGGMLGGFIKWARQSAFPEIDTAIFTFVGHGAFEPGPDLAKVYYVNGSATNIVTPNLPTINSSIPLPMPHVIGVEPALTDMHTNLNNDPDIFSPGMLAPQAMRQALEIGSPVTDKLAVVDFVQCFQGSLENFYELADFADVLIGSANYEFFTPLLLKEALKQIRSDDSAESLAAKIVIAYDSVLQDADGFDPNTHVDYPRTLLAMRGADIPDIKENLDVLSSAIMDDFQTTPKNTVSYLQAAQQDAGIYYDNSFCRADFELNEEDGLIDIGAFMTSLEQTVPGSSVGQAARATRDSAESAVIIRATASGTPAFTHPLTPTWTFTDTGLSLFADFTGYESAPNHSTLSWQGRYYNDDVPVPLQLLQDSVTGATWDDVYNEYWDTKIADGVTISTEACVPDLPFVPESAEVAADSIIFPISGSVANYGAEAVLGGVVELITGTLDTLTVQFSVLDNSNTEIFSTTVFLQNVVAGTHYVEADERWTVATTPFTVRMTVDPSQTLLDDVTSNNQIVSTNYFAANPGSPFVITATTAAISGSLGTQWTDSASFPIHVNSTTSLIDNLISHVYQFGASLSPHTQVPQLIDTTMQQAVNNNDVIPYPVPANANAGVARLHFWGWDAGTNSVSTPPQDIRLNHNPANTQLAAGESDYFIFSAEASDILDFTLSVSNGTASLNLFEPGSLFFAHHLDTMGMLQLVAPVSGDYVVEVVSDTGGEYTLETQRNGTPNARAATATTTISAKRPHFIQPIPLVPTIEPAVTCQVDYNLVSSGGSISQIEVSILSTTRQEGWTLEWSFEPGTSIMSLWNGTHTQNGNHVSVQDVGVNAIIEPNVSLQAFGFLATGSADTIPTEFTLNGMPCYEPEPLYFGGSEHTPLGSAEIEVVTDTLRVIAGGIVTDAYGVSIGTGESDFGVVVFESIDTTTAPDGATLEVTAANESRKLSSIELEVQGNEVAASADFSPLGLAVQRVNIFSGNQLVAEAAGDLIAIFPPIDCEAVDPYWPMEEEGDVWAIIDLPELLEITLSDGTVAQGDRIAFISEPTEMQPISVSEVQVVATKFPEFTLEAEQIGLYHLGHTADAETRLIAENNTLTIAPLDGKQTAQASVDLRREDMVAGYSAELDAANFTTGTLFFGVRGPVDGVDNQLIFGGEITNDETGVRLSADFDTITPTTLTIAVFEQGQVVSTITDLPLDTYVVASSFVRRQQNRLPDTVDLQCMDDWLFGFCVRYPNLCTGGGDIAHFGWDSQVQTFELFDSAGQQITSVVGNEVAFIGRDIDTVRGPFTSIDISAAFDEPTNSRRTASNNRLTLLHESITIMPPPTTVNLYSPTTDGTGRSVWFSANISPSTQVPVTYTWEATDHEPVSLVRTTENDSFWSNNSGWSSWGDRDRVYTRLKWETVGTKHITFTVNVSHFSHVTTRQIDIFVPVPLEGVDLTGPTEGVIDTTYTFTATATPVSATLPIDYEWSESWDWIDWTSSLSPTHSIEHSWNTAGSHLLNVWAYNRFGWAQDVLLFEIPVEPLILTPTIQSTVTGHWDNPSMWDMGRVPDENDVVHIQAGHKITVGSEIVLKSLINDGAIGGDSTELAVEITEAVINNGYIGSASGLPHWPRSERTHSSCVPGLSGATGSGFSVTIAGTGSPSSFTNSGMLQTTNGAAGMSGGDIIVNATGAFNNTSTGIICAGHGGDDTGGTGGNGGTLTLYGAPFDNDGIISAGKGGNGLNGGYGGETYIYGENTTNDGGIYGGDGGHTTGNVSGARGGDGGYVEVWGKYFTWSGFLLNNSTGTIQAGHGGNGNPTATVAQDAGCGGNLLIMAAPNVTLGGTQAAGLGGTPSAGGSSCWAGWVSVDPATITLFGEDVQITGSDITIYGGDEWTLALQDVGTDVFSATGDITLAVGAGGTIDLRGNRDQIFRAGGTVHIYADELLLDEGVPIQALAGTDVVVDSGRIINQVSATVDKRTQAIPRVLPAEVKLQISNASPITNTFDILLTDEQGWTFEGVSSIEIPPMSGKAVILTLNPPNEIGTLNTLTVTAQLQGDPSVNSIVTVDFETTEVVSAINVVSNEANDPVQYWKLMLILLTVSTIPLLYSKRHSV
ncbi:MAG: cellulose binding domain-containing protein [Candidatus Promineifilaceae bacterium]